MTIAIPSTKIEILVDQPLLRRILTVSEEAGIYGFTLHNVLGGGNAQGKWMADQVTGGAGAKVLFSTVQADEEAELFLSRLSPLMDEYGLVVTTTAVNVIRRKPVEE